MRQKPVIVSNIFRADNAQIMVTRKMDTEVHDIFFNLCLICYKCGWSISPFLQRAVKMAALQTLHLTRQRLLKQQWNKTINSALNPNTWNPQHSFPVKGKQLKHLKMNRFCYPHFQTKFTGQCLLSFCYATICKAYFEWRKQQNLNYTLQVCYSNFQSAEIKVRSAFMKKMVHYEIISQ